MTHKLPEYVDRCHGNLYVADVSNSEAMYMPCPSKQQCLRYLARSSAGDYTSWMMAPPDETGRCCKYLMSVPPVESRPDDAYAIRDEIANECAEVETERDKYFAPREYWE